jgi:hypothetical protein
MTGVETREHLMNSGMAVGSKTRVEWLLGLAFDHDVKFLLLTPAIVLHVAKTCSEL